MGRNKVYVANNEENNSEESSQPSELTLTSKPAPADITKKTDSLRSTFQSLAQRAYSSMANFASPDPKISKVHATSEQDFPNVRQAAEERRASAPPVLEHMTEEAEERLFSYYENVVKGGEAYLPSQTLRLTGIPEKTGPFIERRGNACLANVLQGTLPDSVDQQRFICMCMSKSNTTHLDLRELNVDYSADPEELDRIQKQLNGFLGRLLNYNLNITNITPPKGFQLSPKVSDRLIVNEELNAAFYYDKLLTKGETPTNINSGEMQAFIHEMVNIAMQSTAFGSENWTGLKLRQDDRNGQATLETVLASYEQTMLTPMKNMLERTAIQPIVPRVESELTIHSV